MENLKDLLPNWEALTKEEQKRIELVWSEDYNNFEGSKSFSDTEKQKAENYAVALKEATDTADADTPLGANTPLNIPDLKFVDYRDPIWGDSYNWSWNRPLNQVEYLVVHHTVTSHEATPDDIALLHKARGWGGIGYHFVITKDGTCYYVGDIGTARANVADMNEKVIGVALVGDFTKYDPTDEQIHSAHVLLEHFLFQTPALSNVGNWGDVVGHKELTATACPGSEWHTEMKEKIVNDKGETTDCEELKEELKKKKEEYKALDKKYEEFREKNDPKLENYNDAERTLRDYLGKVVDKENFSTALAEVIVDGNTAQRFFNVGKKLIENGDRLEYPKDVSRWFDGMEKAKKDIDAYQEYKNKKLPDWLLKILEVLAKYNKGGVN